MPIFELVKNIIHTKHKLYKIGTIGSQIELEEIKQEYVEEQTDRKTGQTDEWIDRRTNNDQNVVHLTL